ncbi:hypothetical protein LOK49_LG10G02492 [Camellia lanceoleosa]|uniref:Uncharacterized protein n=1 Tax=Camellia lanceoleosa TaxID=1840588 RepID=A0ACC0G6Z4_9ERIC|nr:hypothetical protein LOK49_LG10G02492 [Camellia lanceoleosa]
MELLRRFFAENLLGKSAFSFQAAVFGLCLSSEGQDEYEKDGFIVDDVDEEEPDEEESERADSDEERQKKKKRKKRESEKNYVLDEDDYELLQDNNITGFHRPKFESKKFKRLKKAQRDTDEERTGFSDEEEFDGSGKSGRTAEEKLKRSLFGDDEGPPLEDIAEEELPEEEDGDIGEEDDEMADFIVDEEEVDEHGAPVRRRKPNKKKSRQAPGVSSSALQEAHDIFGDVDELLRLRKQGLAKVGKYDDSSEWRERRLEDEFEPIILSEKYMTEKDDRIREIDLPERMQISEESTGPPPTDEMSIEEESNWIYNQLLTGMIPLFSKRVTETTQGERELSINKDDIMRFLEFMHVQKLDVLWAIQDLDRKWLLLQKRKSALQSYYNKRFDEESRRVYDETRLALNQQLFESITKALKAAESEREVDDVDSKFNLHFPAGEVGADEGQYKRPKRKSQYSICSKAGLWEVASKFGYSSEQFGLQISLEKMRMDELEDAKETPEEMASNFTCAMFETPQAVLKGARHMIIFKMVEDNPRDVGHEMDGLSIVYGDESLPHLYENSRISLDQLSGHSGIVRRAVALGRYLQNPLAMVATLCGPGREILSWKLSPLESFLTADDKYGMIDQVMVDVTNQVGLDVNLAIAHEWLFAPLQFISGLGPRKAASLQRSLVRAGSIYTRKDLLTAHGLGKKVFVNAVGFLRIRRTGLAASSSQFIDLLDDTRIHPESYGLAQELAKDVYLEDVHDDANDDDDMLEMAIEHVREKPDLLKYFDVDEYAKSKKRENKRETLDNIRLELIQGFQDWRRQYVEPSQDDEFYMISGETEDTLAEGRIVQATVRRVQPQRAICGLESGLTGVLTKEDFSDDWRDNSDLSEKLHEGEILTCRIKSIQKNRYQVFLTCRENEMRSNRYQNNRDLDPYYHEDQSSSQFEKEKARKEKELAKKHFKPRMIVHPRFQNITADEAMEFLSDKDPGESIVRPSSRGPSFLTLTLKVYDGVYAHKDIVEGGKEHKDITSLLRIGKTLKIGEDTFEDLDEVMDRYVDPLVTHLKTMLSYRKFRNGTKAEVDELLKIEKSEYPMRIVYCFGISHEHPGTFILTFIRSTNPHHEYIGLYPKGFKFRKKMFEDIDRLVAYFQRHIDDPQHDSGPSIRSVAAMVPMRSPATGGSSGGSFGSGGGWGGSGSNDGGWRGQSMDRERTSTPGSRSGRGDYKNGGNRDGHPSGVPRPFGGRGRGRGGRGNNDRQDSDYSSQKWGAKDGGEGWSSFPGAKVQNSPGREAFPGGWGGGGSGGGGGSDGGGGGWGSSSGGGGGGWGSEGGGGGGGSGWGEGGGGGGSGGDDADAGSSGWGGTKKSSAPQQSGGGGGWSGSSSKGGGGGWG